MAPYYDGLLAFLFRQLFYRIPEVPPLDLHGKAVLLTAANSGIGLSLAMMLASQGAEVTTAVRSITKGEAARQQILRALPTANIEVRQCDLASFDSVRSFVRQLKDESKTFDLLILNAGVWCSQWMASADGFDISLQVNVLSNALMAMSLLPCLSYKTGPPRIVFVTSEGHAMVPTPFAQHGRMLDFFNQKAQAFDHYTHYYTSKLFELLLAQAMSRRIDPGKLSIALVSPGLCKSELFRNVRSAPADLLARCFARTCDAGARIIIMASVTQTESPPDTYFSQGGQVPVSAFVSSSEGVLCQERLWEEIMSILDSVDPDLESHLNLVS